jgi:uncharacterized protein
MRYIFLSAMLCWVGLIGYAQNKNERKDANRSLLWKVSGKDLKKPSYLFGTIHIICKDDLIWTEEMKNSLDKCDKVCFEMDLDDPSLMMHVAMGMLISDSTHKTLADYFTPQQYKLLSAYVQDSLQTNIALFERMRPIALESLMSTVGVHCTDKVSYEEMIMQIAKPQKKEILGIETADEQLEALKTIPDDSVISDLLDELQHSAENSKDYLHLLDAYKEQDLPLLYDLITQDKGLKNDEIGPLLDDRNKKWISRMAPLMTGHGTFFAVGAGHLWGENGVIALLRKAGYKVEPIKEN